MATNAATDFSILARVKLDPSDIQKQLDGALKGVSFTIDNSGVKETKKSVKDLSDEVEDAALTWQQYREMLDTAVDIMKDFAEQTYEVDAALTELRKVTALQNEALDKYVDGLTAAGKQVARTGKPNRSEPE